jgi:hypothetical protein
LGRILQIEVIQIRIKGYPASLREHPRQSRLARLPWPEERHDLRDSKLHRNGIEKRRPIHSQPYHEKSAQATEISQDSQGEGEDAAHPRRALHLRTHLAKDRPRGRIILKRKMNRRDRKDRREKTTQK